MEPTDIWNSLIEPFVRASRERGFQTRVRQKFHILFGQDLGKQWVSLYLNSNPDNRRMPPAERAVTLLMACEAQLEEEGEALKAKVGCNVYGLTAMVNERYRQWKKDNAIQPQTKLGRQAERAAARRRARRKLAKIRESHESVV